ncbi:hypothetical protein V3C99_010308 [Haemonchus contortus]
MLWSQIIFTVTNVISLPFYLLIMVVCVKEWKGNHAQRTFYLLIISQGIADILVMGNYFIFWTLRVSNIFSNFYWSYQSYYVAGWCFNQIYISIYIRCFGVLLASFQRYISLCHSSWRIEQINNTSHRWILPVLQWVIPGCFSVPLVAVTHAVFVSPDNLEVMANQANITLATSMAVVFVSVTFIECALCYGAILRFLMRNRLDNSTAVKRERRLYIQMMGLFVAFALVFFYNIMVFSFSLYTNEGPILTMRTIFPVLTCFFSYVNVWMTLILNDDIRRKMWALLGYHAEKNQSAVKASSSHKVFRLTDPTPSK